MTWPSDGRIWRVFWSSSSGAALLACCSHFTIRLFDLPSQTSPSYCKPHALTLTFSFIYLRQTPNPSTYKVETLSFVAQNRWGSDSKFTWLRILCLGFLCLSSHWSSVVLVFQVKNVYQTSFSAFLDSIGLSGTQDLPQVGCKNCIKCWSLLLCPKLYRNMSTMASMGRRHTDGGPSTPLFTSTGL